MKIQLKKERGQLIPLTDEDYDKLQKLSDASYIIDIKNLDMRTQRQNSALHLWCIQIADLLNANGLKMSGLFNRDIDWTMELVKEQIIRNTIKALFNINSTTKLKRKEIDELIDYLTVIFAEKFKLTLPKFPNRELWDKETK